LAKDQKKNEKLAFVKAQFGTDSRIKKNQRVKDN